MAATALALELLEPGSHVLAMRRNMGRVMSLESWVDNQHASVLHLQPMQGDCCPK